MYFAAVQAWMSTHFACPFGAIASVHAWERVGAAIAFLARKLLHLPVLRYVDDFFAVDWCALSSIVRSVVQRRHGCVLCRRKKQFLSHSMQSFVRLVRVLLGASSISEKKVECGKKLCVLGVDIRMSKDGFRCRPSKDKAKRWCMLIEEVLSSGHLTAGASSKLAGKLSWGGSHLFRRMGRAMLRPIFDQRTRRDGKVDSELRRALEWWLLVLKRKVAEERLWAPPVSKPVHLFCDARGQPPHLAAVLYTGAFQRVSICTVSARAGAVRVLSQAVGHISRIWIHRPKS